MLHLQILCRLPIASETGQVIEGQGEEIARRLLSYSGQSDTRVHIDLVNLVVAGLQGHFCTAGYCSPQSLTTGPLHCYESR